MVVMHNGGTLGFRSSQFNNTLEGTINKEASSLTLLQQRYNNVYIGTVIGSYIDSKGVIKYEVAVIINNMTMPVICFKLSDFSGAQNYKEIINKTNNNLKFNGTNNVSQLLKSSGDSVLVMFIDGNPTQGVIIGGTQHHNRKAKLNPKVGPQYYSTFNGLEESINDVGEYKIIRNGIAAQKKSEFVTTTDPARTLLNQLGGSALPGELFAADYSRPGDTTPEASAAGTYLLIDKDGSITLSDAHSQKEQFIKIDKIPGIISIKAGETWINLEKGSQTISENAKKKSVLIEDHIIEKTKKYDIDSSASMSLKSPKIAIGTDGIELIDQLIKLIDSIGAIVVQSPIGPCTPISSTAAYSGPINVIKTELTMIKGSLS